MHKTKNVIAVINRVANYADCIDIINFLKGFSKSINFTVNSVNAFDSSGKGCFKILTVKTFSNFILKVSKKLLLFSFSKFHSLFNISVTHRVKNSDTSVLKFFHNGSDTKSVRKRRINFHCFMRCSALFFNRFCVDGAHIMKSVGKFYDNNADVLCHSDHHFSDVFCLGFFF